MLKKYFSPIAFFIFLILVDQLSKYLIRLQDGFYICNVGISFGIQLPTFIFWVLWITIIGILIYFIFKNPLDTFTFYLLLILAGALANSIDRIFFGCIIDFIDLRVWPVFNFADIFISIGAILIIIKTFRK